MCQSLAEMHIPFCIRSALVGGLPVVACVGVLSCLRLVALLGCVGGLVLLAPLVASCSSSCFFLPVQYLVSMYYT